MRLAYRNNTSVNDLDLSNIVLYDTEDGLFAVGVKVSTPRLGVTPRFTGYADQDRGYFVPSNMDDPLDCIAACWLSHFCECLQWHFDNQYTFTRRAA